MPSNNVKRYGYEPKKCKAHSSKTGNPCKQWAIPGGVVCNFHGGKTAHVRAKAAERLAALRAEHFLARAGETLSPVDDPVENLSKLAAEVWAVKDYFASQITELRYSNSHTGEQLRAEVALYERALDRCLKVHAEIIRLGIAERKAKIAEAQAVMLYAVVERVLDQLDLSPQQRAISGEIIASEFERISEGQE